MGAHGDNTNTITVKFISSKGGENEREGKIELVLINQKKKRKIIYSFTPPKHTNEYTSRTNLSDALTEKKGPQQSKKYEVCDYS